MSKISILGINGSPKKSGLTSKLLMQCLDQAQIEGAKTQLVHLVDYEKSFFKGDTHRVSEDLKSVVDLLLGANGFVVATPVHWMNMSSLLKNFLDQLTVLEEHNFDLEGKVAGFIA